MKKIIKSYFSDFLGNIKDVCLGIYIEFQEFMKKRFLFVWIKYADSTTKIVCFNCIRINWNLMPTWYFDLTSGWPKRASKISMRLRLLSPISRILRANARYSFHTLTQWWRSEFKVFQAIDSVHYSISSIDAEPSSRFFSIILYSSLSLLRCRSIFPSRCINQHMGGENLSLIQKSKHANFRLINVSGYFQELWWL